MKKYEAYYSKVDGAWCIGERISDSGLVDLPFPALGNEERDAKLIARELNEAEERLAAAVEKVVREEREAVVRWLQTEWKGTFGASVLAGAISRGEHRR